MSKKYIEILTLLSVSYLEAINIHKTYGTRKILNGVNFRASGGETVIIQGPSGAGKTTLLNIISGIDLPDKGKVSLNGINIVRMDEDKRAKLRLENIGLVFQESTLIEDLNILENIALPLKLAGKRWKEKVTELVRYLGIEKLKYEYPHSLSRGEKQRVEIARALANDPQILILDEPTSNLDDLNAFKVMELLQKIREDMGTLIIIATHDVRITNIGDKHYFLKEGKLYED